ncbi:hypothetical protein B0A52_05323 [Exophiala mesophila]|uniref:DNA-directed RNA polymerase III subunit Rpc5 n=1 Tax=Exophiala mesophila TaxID=212818 RepID=A0A438N4R4_EXOME|nr:hypothetical protein B0A52_05323 [Exophiala mesophila]
MADDEDPVVAEYDVYLTHPTPSTSDEPSSKLFLLQYPAHRKSSKPYNASLSQAPSALRLKSKTGFLEVDIPMIAHDHYNELAGEKHGKAIAENRTLHTGGTHGLAGGFSVNSLLRPGDTLAPDTPDFVYPPLVTQTLGGKIVTPSPRDPIYLLGHFRNKQLHLSHLDSVVQMRPQLHHIDAEDENKRRLPSTANSAPGRTKAASDGLANKVESKAIEIKLKDNKDDSKDRSLNDNAKMLRDIQTDEWQEFSWVDQDEEEARDVFESHLNLSPTKVAAAPRLKSGVSNGDWLDKMSAPREDGKKGLLAKLRGRERERARRKKAEEEKRQRQRANATGLQGGIGATLGADTDSDLSSAEDSDVPV